MAFVTVEDAVREVAQLNSLVNGSGMTPYSDETIMSLLAQAHDEIQGEQIWSDLVLKYDRTLDGSTGRITVGIPDTEVSDTSQIFRVYHESSPKPAPRVSGYANAEQLTNKFGWEFISRYQDTGSSKILIQWYPLTLTGDVIYYAKKLVDFTDRDTEIPISFWAHVYWAAWLYSSMDGTNPAHTQAMIRNYNSRLADAKEHQNAFPTNLDPYAMTPDTWVESDDPYWYS